MANEFIARNGIIALSNSQVTGSLSVTNGITGSLFGTASRAVSASWAPTNISSSVTNNVNNYILTATGGSTINGEGNLQFDGDLLYLQGRHQEGGNNGANATYSHAEGDHTATYGWASHAEGVNTITRSSGSHAEGLYTETSGSYSHAEGNRTQTTGSYSHAEGSGSRAKGAASHAEGSNTIASGSYSHAEGVGFEVSNAYQVSMISSSYMQVSIATYGGVLYGTPFNFTPTSVTCYLGYNSISPVTFPVTPTNLYIQSGSNVNVNTEYYDLTNIITSGSYDGAGNVTLFFPPGTLSRVFYQVTGYGNLALGLGSHTEGLGTKATGNYSHAEGATTQAIGDYSHAQGFYTVANGLYSHAEGANTTAGTGAHAEGGNNNAAGTYSHAEGYGTTAAGVWSHSEGMHAYALGDYAHTEGWKTHANHIASHAEGSHTVTGARWQHVQGKWNRQNATEAAFILGNGGNNPTRSNLIVAGNNLVTIGEPSNNSNLYVNGSVSGIGAYINVSDIRYKKDIEPLNSSLNKVMSLKGITFNWEKELNPEINFDDKNHIGFLAQEVEKILPEVVIINPETGIKSIAYGDIIPVLAEAIKDQQQQILELKKLVEQLLEK